MGALEDSGDPLVAEALSSSTFRENDLEKEGQPYFLDEQGLPHEPANAFFASGRMRNRSVLTNEKYARVVRLWLNFLEVRGLSSHEVTERELFDFKFWRRTDMNNPRRVSGSTWQVDLAAIMSFSRWGHEHRGLPLLASYGAAVSNEQFPFRNPRRAGGASTIRTADVKWLTPAAYRAWRDIGVLGKDPSGGERDRWRPRSEVRDSAFADGLYGSGLRIQEWASLLTPEMREPVEGRGYATLRLADACAKGERGHKFWIRRDVVNGVLNYLDGPRSAQVRSAWRSGVYGTLAGVRIVREMRDDGLWTIEGSQAELTQVNVNDLRPSERRLLFRRTREGLVPLSLWLNEDGLPRPKRSWYSMFNRANARVERAGVDRLRCLPHMLRHSFALRWYAVGRLVWDSRNSTAATDHMRDFRYQFGDTWNLVQTMLGHSDVNTTKRIYLEPFQHLDIQMLLEHGSNDLAAETILQVLRDNPRVRFEPTRADSR